MADDFKYDVFLNHSSKDKAIVRDVAERLRGDGLKVWFDEWELKAGDSIPAKIEDALEHSRVLVLCMSAHAFGSDWAQLEAGTFRFRDPLNKDRRFIPLRLDDAPIKGSLAQFLYINWLPPDRKQEYPKLLVACRNPAEWPTVSTENGPDGNMYRHFARLGRARRNEWKRLRADFEAEARKYHNVQLSVFFLVKDGPTKAESFPQPNHVINLWQYYGSTACRDTIDRLAQAELTDFGMSGAQVSAFGLVVGEQTDLFCKMGKRSGSLISDEVNHIINGEILKKFSDASIVGKPILISNDDPLAKWLNLILVVTAASHPARLKGRVLLADPFTASLTVFHYLQLDE